MSDPILQAVVTAHIFYWDDKPSIQIPADAITEDQVTALREAGFVVGEITAASYVGCVPDTLVGYSLEPRSNFDP